MNFAHAWPISDGGRGGAKSWSSGPFFIGANELVRSDVSSVSRLCVDSRCRSMGSLCTADVATLNMLIRPPLVANCNDSWSCAA
jgi:hypothetical protein